MTIQQELAPSIKGSMATQGNAKRHDTRYFPILATHSIIVAAFWY